MKTKGSYPPSGYEPWFLVSGSSASLLHCAFLHAAAAHVEVLHGRLCGLGGIRSVTGGTLVDRFLQALHRSLGVLGRLLFVGCREMLLCHLRVGDQSVGLPGFPFLDRL